MIMGLSACTVGYLSRVSDIPVPTLIFDINGKSTTSKTTCARLAVSIGGSVQNRSDKDSLSATCSTTANTLYGILNDNFGYPILFDETGRFGKFHNYMEMIYALADGTDKARMTKNGTISTVKHWAASVLFTGEAPKSRPSLSDEKLTDEKVQALRNACKANLRVYRLFSFNIVCSNMINQNISINIRFIHLDAV